MQKRTLYILILVLALVIPAALAGDATQPPAFPVVDSLPPAMPVPSPRYSPPNTPPPPQNTFDAMLDILHQLEDDEHAGFYMTEDPAQLHVNLPDSSDVDAALFDFSGVIVHRVKYPLSALNAYNARILDALSPLQRARYGALSTSIDVENNRIILSVTSIVDEMAVALGEISLPEDLCVVYLRPDAIVPF